MGLRKRSYKKDRLVSTYLHNRKVERHQRRRQDEAKDHRENRERTKQQRALEKDVRRTRAVEARLKDAGIEARWADVALEIMDEYGYGLGQIKTKVVLILKPRISQALRDEAAAARNDRVVERMCEAANNELDVASEQLFSVISRQVVGARHEIERQGSNAVAEDVAYYFDSADIQLFSVEVPAPYRRLIFTVFSTCILITFLFISIFFAINALSETLPGSIELAGLAILLIGIWLIVRNRRRAFLSKTAPFVVLSSDAAVSFLTERLTGKALKTVQTYPHDRRFMMLLDFESCSIPIAQSNAVQELAQDLYRLPRFRGRGQRRSKTQVPPSLQTSIGNES